MEARQHVEVVLLFSQGETRDHWRLGQRLRGNIMEMEEVVVEMEGGEVEVKCEAHQEGGKKNV